jgi:LuxR family transcriptional regulator, maltose regulon positive regulatory protein
MAASPALATNLPAQLSSFIGRRAELAAVSRLLAGSRLVTLTGAGGVGKTRLALQVAAGLADGADDGVWFADLAPLQDPDLVWVTVADVLGVRQNPDRPVAEAVVQGVGGRRLLLVLDNCEHLIGTCAKLADALLRGCPNVALLATSREPLGIGGEQVYRVPSLGLPADSDDAEAIEASEAVRLLADRAAAQGAPLGWDERAVQLAGRICRRLDGIPLGIELAAARLRVMSADELETRLDERFALLTGGSRAGLARQQTLRAMVDWSWELLNPAEQAVLARLSVFAGGFGLAAAEAVAECPDVTAGEVPVQLGALVDKSLVQFGDTGAGPGRYRLLETVRQYAAGQLDALGRPAAETARLAHSDYYLALAEEAAPHLVAADQVAWLTRLDTELGNLRAAVAFSLTRADPVPGLRLATSLRAYWRIRGHAAEGADVLQALLAIPAAQPAEMLRARALTDAAHLIMHTGDYAIAEEYCQEALAIARAAGDGRLVAEVLSQYATVLLPQGKADAALPLTESGLSLARPLAEPHLTARLLAARAFATSVAGDREASARDAAEALRLFRLAGDQIQTAQALDNIGYDELSAGDLDAARRHLAEALNITRALNDRNGIVYQTLNLGLAEYLGGSPEAAGALFGESFDLASRTGMRSQVGYALVGLALAGHGAADPGWSARLHGAADEALADQGSVLEPLEAGLVDLDRDRLRAAMGADAFEAEYTQGRTLDPAQVRAALVRTDTTAGPPPAASDEPVTGTGAGRMVARPELLRRLGGPARVTVVSAPPGSGKTVLLRSWISQPGLSGRTAWVAAGPDNQDPLRFWRSVLGALGRTGQGPALVRGLTTAPDRDGWAIAERLLTDLAPLTDPIWLVIDDLHELGPEASRQLELLVMRAPPGLRFVLAAQHEVVSGLHRLRLEGELAEIRGPDLRFTVAEAAELFAAAGVELPDPALALLVERTEGWAAGLRLAALSLAGNPDPERFAWEFSGTERTVAEYLLAEVLDRQPEPVRRLLLRTSVLERVNGELADLLTGDEGGEQVLQDLADANALVVPLDAGRSWFRYHQMLADLLALELRRTAPGEIAGLHQAAAGWLVEHEHPVEAVGQAQAAQDWGLGARLLSDFWPGLYLDGQSAVARQLLAGFPAEASAADAELAAVAAGDELARGSLGAAERYLGLAERGSASVPDGRRAQLDVLLGIVRMLLARGLGNPEVVAEQARRLQAPESAQPDAAPAARAGLGDELRALALISLGSAEAWTGRLEDAERHLEQGVALAGQVRRPYLEFSGLAYLAAAETGRSFARAAERSRQAIELANRHGWTDEPALGSACFALGSTLTWQGRLEEAGPWVQRAEGTVGADDPEAGTEIHYVRGILELARGRAADALAAFRTAERLARRLAPADLLVPQARAMLVQALVRLGETERAEQILDGLGEHDRADGQTRIATAVLRLAQRDPSAAGVALAPLLDGSAPVLPRVWQAHAFLLETIIRDALGDSGASGRALEGALDLAEPDGAIWAFLLHPVPGLLERHAGHGTAHAALIAEILSLLAGRTPAGREPPLEPVSDSEMRVLRYLPTNLTAPEIARELYVSRNTVKVHMRSLYAKFGTHSRADTVARARALGLLAPSALRGQARPAG